MLSITKYLLGCRDIETIMTYEDSQILHVRLENDKSDPELYILENLDSSPISKSFLIIEDNNSFDYSTQDLKFVGEYEFRNGVHKFFLFELLNFESKNITSFSFFTTNTLPKYTNVSYTNNEIDVNKKYARLPKPDFKRIYTKEELQEMHPKKQLQFLLLNKFNVPKKLAKKISINNQIEYILKEQDGIETNVSDFVDIARKKYTRKNKQDNKKVISSVKPLFNFDSSISMTNIPIRQNKTKSISNNDGFQNALF